MLDIVSFKRSERVRYIHMVHMSFYLPSTIHLLFRSLLSEKATASHAVSMTELQLFYSEKACEQNGWPAVNRK